MRVPGRLKMEENLSGVRIQLPGEQRWIRRLYLGVVSLMTMSGVVGIFSGGPPLGMALLSLLVFVLILALVAGVLWLLLSRLLQWMQSGSRLAFLVLLLMPLVPAVPIALGLPNPGPAVIFLMASTLFWTTLVLRGVPPAAWMTIDQSTLQVERRGTRITIPLENIGTLQRATRSSAAMLGQQAVGGLGELSQAEWDWLAQTITESVARRRKALMGEGHDLSREAVPPKALAALTAQKAPTSHGS